MTPDAILDGQIEEWKETLSLIDSDGWVASQLKERINLLEDIKRLRALVSKFPHVSAEETLSILDQSDQTLSNLKKL